MKKLIYTFCLMSLFISCQRDELPDISDRKNGSVILNLKSYSLSPDSKATESGESGYNENKIERVNVFVFPEDAGDNQVCLQSESHTNLTFNSTNTFAHDLTMSKDLFTEGVIYDIYAIANLPLDVALPTTITLGALKSLRTTTPIKGIDSQLNFVMDGKVSAILNPGPSIPIVYVDMKLKRAASKVRVTVILEPTVPFVGVNYVQTSLRHHAKHSSMLDKNPYMLTPNDYDNSDYITSTNMSGAVSATFYCYENNWGTTSTNETFLLINVPYLGILYNYYRMPLNKYANDPATGRTERNMIYDVTVHIDRLGAAIESDAVITNGNCTILNWTTKDIVLKTINQHYLGINEYNIVMPNTSSFTLKYVSDLPVSVTNITAMCTQYNSSGVASTVTYTSGQPQFPTFTINPTLSTITINSTIPVNYVPKYITFTVTNNSGLSLNATIVQYPARYVTARLSTGNIRPEWNQGGTNLNLFTVNTLVPSSNNSYTFGDPTNGFPYTDSTSVGNKMVSPKFIIASQYGIYNRVLYGIAQNRCAQYGEDIYRSGWRMPTKAEIELINAIQDDTNSAVKALLTGDAYWSAFKYNYYNFVNNTWTTVNDQGTAYIRCVHDIYQ